MDGARKAILEGRFPQYLISFFRRYFQQPESYPFVIASPCLSPELTILVVEHGQLMR